MKPAKVPFTAIQGSTFNRVLTYKIDGEIVDITGWTARMQIRETPYSDEYILDLDSESYGITIDGPAGTIEINIDADRMSLIYPGSYVFDLDVMFGGNVDTLIYGDFIVKGDVTR